MFNLFEFLENSYQKFPEKIAIIMPGKKINYREYYEKSILVAKNLKRMNLDLKKPFLILTNDDEKDLYIFMGILAVGGFYVSMDKKTKTDRINSIVEKFSCHLISSENIEGCINFSDLFKDSDSDFEISKNPLNPALGMFTSGTTGEPKLVLKNHASIISMCEAFCEVFDFCKEDIFGNQVSFEFDSCLKSIFLNLYNSSAIALIPSAFFMFPKKLLDFLEESDANILIWSTFALRIIENFKAFSYKNLKNIKYVMFSGEKIPGKTIKYWLENLDSKYINLYAPTEFSFNCCYHEIKSTEDFSKIPIGREFPGSKILIVKENNKAKSYEQGEIYIGGVGLSMGYYKNIYATENSFVQNPLQDDYPEIFYKTGDYGYFDESSRDFYFIGRIDNQIKHLGYRIELGEIETVANDIFGVNISAAIFEKEKERIILFYEGEIPEKDLKKILKTKLKKQLQPKDVIKLEKMPLNKNNKVDRKKLKSTGD